MFSTAVISCVFWFTEECHLSVLQEMSIPSVVDIYTVGTSDTAEPIGTASNLTAGESASVADPEPENYYQSYFNIDLGAIIQAFVTFDERDATYLRPIEQAVEHKSVPYQQNAVDVGMPRDEFKELLAGSQPQPKLNEQDDANTIWSQQSFFETMLGRGHDFSKQDDSDVRMAQKYFEEMLAQPKTTTSSGFLSKFDRFDGQTCSLRKTEPLASYHSSTTSTNIDPSLCAGACMAVKGCSGFRIFQFRGLTYCDLMSTCTEDRLEKVPSKSLSTFLLSSAKDATRRPSFDYYYEYDAAGGYFIPILILFATICFALVACRIQRKRRLLAARAAARRYALRSTSADTNKDQNRPDPEIIVIGRCLERRTPPRPSRMQRVRKQEPEDECQEF